MIATTSGLIKKIEAFVGFIRLKVMNYFPDLMLSVGEAVAKLNNFYLRIAFLATKIEAKIKCYECFTNDLAVK